MQNYLMGYPFNFRNASIMSGLEEGLYGWITVNYLMGNFLEVSSLTASPAFIILLLTLIEILRSLIFFYQSLIYSYSFVEIQDQIQIVAQWWSVIETFHFFNFSLFYRKLYGMPGYILMELRPLAHWIWVEPPPRLPLPSLMMLTEKTLSRFHSMAMTTTSTHTVFSAMGEMKLKRECWPNFQRYMTSCFHM